MHEKRKTARKLASFLIVCLMRVVNLDCDPIWVEREGCSLPLALLRDREPVIGWAFSSRSLSDLPSNDDFDRLNRF